MEFKEQIQRILENVPKVYEAGKSSINQEVSNALKGSASGEAVALKDVSPIEHRLGVKVESKNMLDPTNFYTDFGSEVGYTLNEDKTLSFSGTASGLFQYNFFYDSNNPIVCTEDMFVSGCPSGGAFETYCLQAFVILPNGTETYLTEYGDGMVVSKGSKIKRILAIIRAGANVDGLTFEPMLIKGTKKKPYTPYIADTSGVKLKVQGGNLIPYPYTETTKTVNGITFTDNGDGTITANGTATSQAAFYLLQHSNMQIAQDAFLSGCPAGGSYSTYFLEVYNGNTGYKADIGRGILIPKDTIRDVYIVFKAGVTVENVTFKPQLKIGTTAADATEYEPYKEPIEYAQGEDIKSIYPTTTIMTDTEGAVVEVEYNRDLNKAFAELYQAIISLGGNV